jgi:hypothetical protein
VDGRGSSACLCREGCHVDCLAGRIRLGNSVLAVLTRFLGDFGVFTEEEGDGILLPALRISSSK